MKVKFSLGEGGVKGFFVNHGEKLGLIVVAGVAAVILFAGYGIEAIPDNQTPIALKQKAEAARQHISSGSWKVVGLTRDHDMDLVERVQDGRKPIDADQYPIPLITGRPVKVRKDKRPDPELYGPTNVEVSGGYVAIALQPRTGREQSRVDLLEFAKRDEEDDSRPSSRSRSRTDEADALDPFGIPGVGGGRGSRGGRGGGAALPPGYGGEMEDTGADAPPDSGFDNPYGGPIGSTPGMMGEYKQIPANALRKLPGVRVNSGVATGVYMISVRAVVPYERQWTEYENKLGTAVAHQMPRDLPDYIDFEVQRLDVTDDPSQPVMKTVKDENGDDIEVYIDDLPWQLVGNLRSEQYRMQFWAGQAPQVIDAAYYDGALTMPVPPILLRDYEPHALHSDVPRKQTASVAVPTSSGTRELDPTRIDDILKAGPAGAVPGVPGGALPGAMPGVPGTMPGVPGIPGFDGSGVPPGYGETPEGDAAPPTGGPGDFGADGSSFDPYSGSPYGGPGSGATSGTAYPPPTKPYKLVRFFQLVSSPEPGRSYRYRVRVVLADPNNPDPNTANQRGSMSPGSMPGVSSFPGSGGAGGTSTTTKMDESMLQPEVVMRLRDQRAKDEVANKTREPKFFTYWRETEWSQPSDVITIPASAQEAFAGGVDPGTEIQIPNVGKFLRDEPSGKVVASVWDHSYATNVPAETGVKMSSVLNFETNADVIHPIDLSVRRIENYDFDTNMIVLDVRGGETLPGKDRKNRLQSGGEFLILDAEGNLIVRDELDDMPDYRLLMLIDDAPPAPPRTPGGPPGGMPGMPPGMMPPGVGGGGVPPGLGGFLPASPMGDGGGAGGRPPRR